MHADVIVVDDVPVAVEVRAVAPQVVALRAGGKRRGVANQLLHH